MQRQARTHRPAALQVTLAIAGLLVLMAAYIVAMRLTVDISRIGSNGEADHRDAVYLAIHGGGLVAASVAGFALGKFLSGLGVAFSLLFLIVVGVGMVSVQVGSYQLACTGHNDLIRHWTC
jgi:hypothetical protein